MVHGIIFHKGKLYEAAYVSDESSIRIIFMCKRTFQGPLVLITLQALPIICSIWSNLLKRDTSSKNGSPKIELILIQHKVCLKNLLRKPKLSNTKTLAQLMSHCHSQV
ncbi:hypothetical protein KPH14_005568 [Odynerus spinipes]|uniref:Uncharacterized protein n=1 Tax=Odynerus spinipes TaxID=1348599 RepID=A0AAD9RCL2_9HYME|nr:hypothetical protein KPH14_005568 [Odynerus spinipes]